MSSFPTATALSVLTADAISGTNIVDYPDKRAVAQIEGVGIGLRAAHIDQVLINSPAVAWFEILAENHMASGGLIPMQLGAIRERYPITLHCVGMSLAGTSPLQLDYLANIKRMMQLYQPVYVSDHISFCHHWQGYYHDLLPFPYSEESLLNMIARVNQTQDFLGTRLLLENATRYVEFQASSLSEIEFISALLDETDCGLLLDLNNLYVNAVNHGSNPFDYLSAVPWSRVNEIHLAGFSRRGDILIDSHNDKVDKAVWDLYRHAMQQAAVPTLIEWDSQLPELSVLLDQASQASRIMQQATLT